MTVTHMEILGPFGESFPSLGLTRQTKDALARYCALRWPQGRRKAVEREWGLSSEQARSVCEGTPSATTVDRIWKHKNGGWAVLLPVMGAVIGESADQFIEKQRRTHLENATRLRGLARDLRDGSSVFPDRRHGVTMPERRKHSDRLG